MSLIAGRLSTPSRRPRDLSVDISNRRRQESYRENYRDRRESIANELHESYYYSILPSSSST